MKNLLLTVFISLLWSYGQAQSFTDPNFSVIPVISGWTEPVGAAFSRDAEKLFVWEKSGFVYVCNKSGSNYVKQTTPVIDLTAEVLNWRDHGLMGFALDPDYLNNGYIYLLYIVDRRFLMNDNSIVADAGHDATIARLTKYRTVLNGSNLVVDPSTRTILIGESPSTGIPVVHESHVIGSLAFAADGTLLVSTGDGASYYTMDAGSDGDTYWDRAIQDGILRPAENVGAFRSQILNCHNGKLLRIDPNTGNGIASNPFYSAAQPRAPKSRVWAMGFRNAFRILVKPGTGSTNPATGDIGEVYVGDVGWSTWEEFSIITGPGMNCGWPIYEGHQVNTSYNTVASTLQNQDEPNPLAGQSGCTRTYFTFRELIKDPTRDENKTINNPCNSSVVIGTNNRYVHRRPAIDYKHEVESSRVGIFNGNNAAVAEIGTPQSGVVGTPFAGNCALAGVWYTGSNFPPEFKNTFLLVDHTARWIKRFTIDFTDVVIRVDNFVSVFANTVTLAENPVDGTLLAVDIATNSLKKIQYGGNQPPVAKITANVNYGSSPLTVNFTGNTSFDLSPGGSIASYSWNFGGGNPATSTTANPSGIVFTDATGNPRKFVVKLTVTDNGGATDVDSVIISVNNTPPVVNITSPVKNSTYAIGGGDIVYPCTATVTDAEHSGTQLHYEWQTILRHNNHEHPEPIDTNVTTTTTISRVGCNGDTYYWLVKLKVTDAAGLSTSDSSKIFPDCGVDNIPPVVTSTTPVNGVTGVGVNTIIIANFSEAINASTVTNTSFQLKNAANNIVSATVNTASNQITLTPTSALAGSTVYTATIKGGTSGVKDLAGISLASDYNWSFTTAGVETIPPTVTSVSPVNGATGVGTGTNVIANFSEAVNGTTVTASTFQLRDGGNNLVGATINTSGGQITLTPSAALTGSTVYTATITGGASGVKDLAGNALVNNYSWSFTTASSGGGSTTYTVFAATATPMEPTNNDGQGIAVGVKFRSSQNGFINGIRYYKGAGSTGTHTGHLWTSAGTLMGSTTFTGETASGWQQALFASPIAITANTVYVASMFSPSGYYAATDPYFTTAVVNGPLTALSNTESPNGLYRYTATNAFPNSSFNASNYWVDVVFATGSTTVAPTVTTHPVSQSRCAGANASFTSAASGTPSPTVQWQSSPTGTTWTNITGATTATLTFAVTTADNAKQYRAVWSNSAGTVNSNASVLTVNAIPALSSSLTATATSGIVFNYTPTSNTSGTTFTWSRSAVTGISNAAANGTGNISETLVNTTSSNVNVTYVYTLNAAGCSNTQNVVVTVNPGVVTVSPSITTQPASQSKCSGENASFTSAASGTPSPTVQWQSSPTGTTWTNITGATNATLTFAVTTADNAKQYRAVWSNSAGTVNSNAAVLTVNAIPTLSSSLTASSTSGTVFNYTPTSNTSGTTFTWSRSAVTGISNVAANGTGNISETLVNTTSSNVNVTYVYTLSAAGCSNTQNVVVTVNPEGVTVSPSVTTQPASQTKCAGTNASFTSAATGTPSPTVQWQSSPTGTTWTNITGATNPTLTFAVTATDNAKQYRAVWSNSAGTVNSDPATLTVNVIPATPTVTVTNNCGNSVLSATGTTGTLLWSTGASTSSVTVSISGSYTVTQTENGCTSLAGSGTAAPKPIPVLSSNLSAIATSGTAFTYTATSATSGTTFAWSRAAVTGISNAAANGTGNINETLVNTTAAPVNVTYVYTLTASGCSNTQNLVVTVNPISVINCVINGSITSSFNSTSIPAGRYIWFNSVFDRGSFGGISGTVTYNVTNSVITFTANSQQYTLNVPNSRIRFDAAVTSASTQFLNGVWETAVPRSYSGYVFMGGLSYLVPATLPGNISNVRWTANISIDKVGASLSWRWSAAVYTSFAAHTGLNVKPKNGSTQNPYPNNDNAGTPENFKSFLVSGAKGTGGTNYTGTYSSTSTATCVVTPATRTPAEQLITRQILPKKAPALPIDRLESEILDVSAVPNPSNSIFNLIIKGSNKNSVQVRVTDVFGRIVEHYEKISANTTLQIGQRLRGGSFFVEVIQADQRKFVKIIKVN